MAENKTGADSSDSEAYLSADEGLSGNRGSGKIVAVNNSNKTKTDNSNSNETIEHIENNPQDTGNGSIEVTTDENGASPDFAQSGNGSRAGEEKVGVVGTNQESDESTTASEDKVKHESSVGEKGRRDGETERVKDITITEIESVRTCDDVTQERDGSDEEGEKTPIPPPRRKRKKKLQKNPSLENLEKIPNEVRTQRSLTVGSVDMSRERLTAVQPITSFSPSSHPTPTSTSHTTSPTKPLESEETSTPEVRGAEFSPPSPRGLKSGRQDTENRGTMRECDNRSPLGKNAPSISIEPNTSLELTEDMVHGQSEVMTRDMPFARASGSDRHETEIIFDSDDESDGEGVYGSQELPVPPDENQYPDGDVEETRGTGQGIEVTSEGRESEKERGSERDHKEKTPVAADDEEKRANSPSDNQILQMTIVKNLDTGDSFPLSVVDEKIPLGNPLNQHLYHRTAAMESHGEEGSGEEGHHRRRPLLKKKLRQFWGKRRPKTHGDGMARVREGETMSRGHMTGMQDSDMTIKYKPCSHHKGPYDFDRVRLKQDLTGPHLGAVWVMEFSICGRLLAVAGQDNIVRVWVLRTAAQFFHELQAKYQRFGVHSSGESLAEKASMASTTSSEEDDANASKGPFLDVPICTYHGHSADVLDLSWSKNFFLLSSSMDKTVRLWHISRKECLCCFQHVDFVTAIAFHPRDDRYFLSGSLDGKLRLWNIPDKRVALWNEIEGVGSHLITATNFCMNGKLAVAGTYDGRCIFYETEHLKYHTQIHVRSRHGKNRGRKVSGIEPLPGEDKILVTTNDSRLRLYNLKDHSLSCKYKGCLNTSSQIRATFSRDGLNIICGSEDHFIYVWSTHHDVNKLSSVRRDRNEFYESFTTHHAPVTAAVFAPVPGITVDEGLKEVGQMIVAGDYQGGIKVYVNSEKL